MKIDLGPFFDFVKFLVILFIIAIISPGVFLLMSNASKVDIKQQAIERGYALHCPKDGKFAWKGECEQ